MESVVRCNRCPDRHWVRYARATPDGLATRVPSESGVETRYVCPLASLFG